MVLKPDQERVKGLLKDTIALLCKNGLDFKEEFSIDAVIGVTLDRDNLFYISMAETIKVNKPLIDKAEEPSDDEEISLTERRGHKRKKDLDENSSEESDGEQQENDQQYSEHYDEVAKHQQSHRKRLSSRMPVKEEIDEDDEIMIVKEEPRESWGQDGGTDQFLQDMTFDNFPNQSAGTSSRLSQSGSSFLNTSDLGSLSNIPVDAEDGSSAVWPGGFQIGASQLRRVPPLPTSDNSSSQQELSQGSMDQTLSTNAIGNVCTVCSKVFNSASSMRRHYKAHYGIHPYSCPVCHKGFTSKGNLKGHISSTHTGVKDFKCSVCEKEFSQKVSLKTHLKSVHNMCETLTDASEH